MIRRRPDEELCAFIIIGEDRMTRSLSFHLILPRLLLQERIAGSMSNRVYLRTKIRKWFHENPRPKFLSILNRKWDYIALLLYSTVLIPTALFLVKGSQGRQNEDGGRKEQVKSGNWQLPILPYIIPFPPFVVINLPLFHGSLYVSPFGLTESQFDSTLLLFIFVYKRVVILWQIRIEGARHWHVFFLLSFFNLCLTRHFPLFFRCVSFVFGWLVPLENSGMTSSLLPLLYHLRTCLRGKEKGMR